MPKLSEVQYAAISAVGVGDNEVVAAVAAKKIRVVGFFLVAVTAVTVAFESSAGGDALTGDMSLGAPGVLAPGYNPLGGVETVAGENLNLELGGAVQVSGAVSYVLVD